MSGLQFQWIEDSFPPPEFHLNTPQPHDGRTYIMYHGTTRANAKKIKAKGFQRSASGMLGPGVYLSRDLEKARRYPINHPDKDRVIIKVKVNVGRVIAIRKQNHPLQKTWSSHGYDSAWVPPNCGMVNSGLEENCIWDPSRIEVIEVIKPQLLQASFRASSSHSSGASSLPPLSSTPSQGSALVSALALSLAIVASPLSPHQASSKGLLFCLLFGVFYNFFSN